MRVRPLFFLAVFVFASRADGQSAPDSVRRDSAQVLKARRDSLARLDSLAKRDSVTRDSVARDSIRKTADSATVRESIKRDSTAIPDTTVARDSVVATDSTVVRDSIVVKDSTAAKDSTVARDSTTSPPDSARAADTTATKVVYTPPKSRRINPPNNYRLKSGRTLADSLELDETLRVGKANPLWPVRTPPPLPGSILPAKRIIAFYGTPLSRRMGVLGQYPQEHMLAKLDSVVAEWNAADSTTPAQAALHFIAVVAQAGPGKDNKYRLRMDSALIEKVYGWAHARGALLFLDIQAGHSTIVDELPRLAKFLERPDVHLGIDPEFNMRYVSDTIAPGKMIGTMKADEINETISFLARLTTEKQLPPKVLVIHRFRAPMVRNARDIKLDPRVQVVMHMDGWGTPAEKYGSYREFIVNEPVQYTGFKLFYRNDTFRGDKLLSPAEILQVYPRPLYIQYQ